MQKRPGFTLIELIIVIAIIAIVVSAVFVALNPVQRLNDARNARAKQDAVAIDKAIQLYMVENGRIPEENFPLSNYPTGTESFDICESDGVVPTTGTWGCVDLDFLITEGYLPKIDARPDASAGVTGYQISFNQGAYTTVDAPVIDNSTIFRPSANIITPWTMPNDYSILVQEGDIVTQPTLPTDVTLTEDHILASGNDDGERQAYSFGAVPASSQITIWMYAFCAGATPSQILVDVSINGGTANTGIVPLPSSSPAWRSVTISGSLPAGTLAVGMTAPASIVGTWSGCYIFTMYADVQ